MAKPLKNEFETAMVVRAHGMEIKIGNHGDVQFEKGGRVLTVTEDLTHLTAGDVTVTITDDTISFFGGNIKVQDDGVARVVPVEDDMAVITSLLDIEEIKPGDTIGLDHYLLGGDQRFQDWFVYNVKKEEGIIQVMEPEDRFGLWTDFVSHIEDDLKPQGHVGARVMVFDDVSSIFNNLMLTDLIEKAPISLYDYREWSKRFFSGEARECECHNLAYVFDKRGTQCHRIQNTEKAYGFAVQDIALRALQR